MKLEIKIECDTSFDAMNLLDVVSLEVRKYAWKNGVPSITPWPERLKGVQMQGVSDFGKFEIKIV